MVSELIPIFIGELFRVSNAQGTDCPPNTAYEGVRTLAHLRRRENRNCGLFRSETYPRRLNTGGNCHKYDEGLRVGTAIDVLDFFVGRTSSLTITTLGGPGRQSFAGIGTEVSTIVDDVRAGDQKDAVLCWIRNR